MYVEPEGRNHGGGTPRSMRFETAFTVRDDIAFIRALERSFPGSQVRTSVGQTIRVLAKPDQIAEIDPQATLAVTLAFSSEAEWKTRRSQRPPMGTRWNAFVYRRSRFIRMHEDRKWAFDGPILSGGLIYCSYFDMPDWQKTWLLQVRRALQMVSIKTKGWPARFLGFDACRWRLEGGPRRSILGTEHDVPADWIFPTNNPFYAGLDDIPRGDEGLYDQPSL